MLRGYSLTSDVISAKEIREQSEKQSVQTVITAHCGENKRIGLTDNTKYYTSVAGVFVMSFLFCIDFILLSCIRDIFTFIIMI